MKCVGTRVGAVCREPGAPKAGAAPPKRGGRVGRDVVVGGSRPNTAV